MRILEFTVAIPQGVVLNANQRLHWRRKAEFTKAIRTATWAKAHPLKPHAMAAADCTVWIKFPDRRLRDEHNFYVTVKAAVDGIIDAGILPDDSTKYLTGPDIRPSGSLSPAGLVELTFQFTERPVGAA